MGSVVNLDAQGAQFDEDGGAFDASLSTALMVGGAGYFAMQGVAAALCSGAAKMTFHTCSIPAAPAAPRRSSSQISPS